MRWLDGQYDELDDPGMWLALAWTFVVIFGAVFAATLALPALPDYVDGPITARALFHPEWLVVATFLVLPVYRAARSSWRAGIFVVLVACIYVLYVVHTAVGNLRDAGLTSSLYAGWYAVALTQVALFLTVGAVGARRNFIDGRWVRTMRRVTALPAPDRALGNNPPGQPRPPEPPGRPRNGFAA